MNVAVAVGEGVKQKITTASLSQKGFQIRRSYAEWDLELRQLHALKVNNESELLLVDVVTHPLDQAVTQNAIRRIRFTIPVDIAVRKKLPAENRNQDTGLFEVEDIDELVQFTQEIFLLFMPQRLTEFHDDIVWDQEAGGTRILANPDTNHLHDWGQFTSIIRVFFRYDMKLGEL